MMNRRQAIKSIGIAAALPLSSSELLALARGVHSRLQSDDAGRYIFRTLDPHQNDIVTAATELILPETDTPGAKSARVSEFIDLLLTEWFTDDERRPFLRGIRELDERAERGFLEASETEQVAILKEMESEAREALDILGDSRRDRRQALSTVEAPFFSALKWLTLYGYFTSEVGMEKELEHVVFPGTYEGCTSMRR
jgi:hypothetical protein